MIGLYIILNLIIMELLRIKDIFINVFFVKFFFYLLIILTLNIDALRFLNDNGHENLQAYLIPIMLSSLIHSGFEFYKKNDFNINITRMFDFVILTLFINNYYIGLFVASLYLLVELYERSKKANYEIESVIPYFVPLLFSILVFRDSILSITVNYLLPVFVVLLILVESGKLKIARLFAIYLIVFSFGKAISASYIFISLYIIAFTVFYNLLHYKFVTKININIPYFNKMFLKAFLLNEKKEKAYVLKSFKFNKEKVTKNKSGFVTEYSNDTVKNFVNILCIFCFLSMYIIFRN